MPRYHLNLYNDEVTIDHEGVILPDLDEVKRYAIHGGREVIAAHVMAGKALFMSHHIDITNTEGAVLHSVSFGDLVQVRS
ncbi:hypothetical protein KCP91_14945 [Microvirga sp. SRT01]|uniref:DUF6894 domain-containing protein n=1 Tax=Sphingomonas longa TaxID=2778730 RepID=A0ABS2D9W0_9SPHN|nr:MULTISPECIES: hypothetical protein [Alphaproteobacteria]MBM6577678.1 hypothetical protein [Sphingomonas sp. BT552]MBR7710721.1 hypothetical protein [Microvirga sp. SRT01]